MNDEEILNKVLDKNSKLSGPKISKLSQEDLDYLSSRYPDSEGSSITEILYRIKNNINNRPICPICGSYRKFKTVKFYLPTCGDAMCVYKNMEQTFQTRYGAKSGFSAFKDSISKTIEDKYGVDNPAKSKVIWDKMKLSGSLNKSKEEDLLFDILSSEYPSLIRNYKSDEYPYFADFYLPEKNLYIEYHGSMFHNCRMFSNSIEDQIELEKLKSKSNGNDRYAATIYTWTILDPAKISIALKNKINYLVIFPHFLSSRNKLRAKNVIKYKNEILDYLKPIIEDFNLESHIQKIVGERKWKLMTHMF